MTEFDDVLREIEVGVDISEGNYDILRYYRDEYKDLLAEVKRMREIIEQEIVSPRSKQFFMQHYGKDDFEEVWEKWVAGIQDKYWGIKE